ncbi:uncharacterized protein Dwil_GK25321 [Drosophila willistoni]|uniref:DUF4781 domain-containing protein n=1 Tax=Drosophila willistoni TaxID=7260 RepID=B4N3X3_DROWI|nr:uncharacterized protein LOC6645277 [Drosophila willistoni]EDW79328.2 uncharacterized protein Dwil_GK25321 [Drosophila willistoni]
MAEAIITRTTRRQQEFFAELLGTEEILWDHGTKESLNIKVKELIRDPTIPTAVPETAEEKKKKIALEKQIEVNKRLRETLYNAVWNQRKYSNKQLLSNIIYVLVAGDTTDINFAEDATTWSCHPVFRTRRCVVDSDGQSGNSSDCCMTFVDETGRVYSNWDSYVSDNVLPAGVMVAPHRGIYRLVENVQLRLDKYLTPAASGTKKAIGVLDTTSAIGGITASCVPIAALLSVPVAAPVFAVAGVVGLLSAGYATIRSGSQLVDRSQHEQSINVTEREPRGHWLGVVAGAVGLGAAGASTAIVSATTAGKEVGAIAQLTVNGMNITSIVISGTGVANGVLDLILKYQDGDDVTAVDALQLSASLVLFTHSVYNFRLASTIVNDTANSKIAGYRETLSNRQRRAFDKVSKETIRIRGPTRGKLDVIRNVNEGSKQQFNDLFKINKQLNEKGVKASFASDGADILLNDQVRTNAADLRASAQHNVGPDILGQVSQDIPQSYETGSGTGNRPNTQYRLFTPNPTMQDPGLEPANYAPGVYALELSTIVIKGVRFLLSDYGTALFEHIYNAESFEYAIRRMANELSPEVFNHIMNLTKIFVENLLDDLTSVLKFCISSESVLYQILEEVLKHYRNNLQLEEIQNYTSDILRSVYDYFQSLNPNSYPGLLTKCKHCAGYFHVSQL